eukprot:6030288-Alexandrium_andersonii.AAC.1
MSAAAQPSGLLHRRRRSARRQKGDRVRAQCCRDGAAYREGGRGGSPPCWLLRQCRLAGLPGPWAW